MNPSICTHSGIEFDFKLLQPDRIVFKDIGSSIAKICRFTGHSSVFYSVAEHSFLMSHIVPEHLALYALLHDSAEAYVGDVSAPLKSLFPRFRELEDRILGMILAKAGLEPTLPGEIHYYDRQMLAAERRALMPPIDWWPSQPPEIRITLACWSWWKARAIWLQRFRDLTLDLELS